MEKWLPMVGHPKLEVSNHGRVRSVARTRPMPYGGVAQVPSRIRKPQRSGGRYIIAYVNEHGRTINIKVHRAVAEAFIGPAPFPGAVVMHLDEDWTSNHVSNLKWGTQKENLNAPGFIAYCRSRTGERHPRAVAERRAA